MERPVLNTVSLCATASYLPEKVVENSFFDIPKNEAENLMFKGVRKRHHVSPDETPVEMIAQAASRLSERLNLNLRRDLSIILTNVTLPTQFFTGCGAEVAYRLGANPQIVLDVHNGGCVSFIVMIDLARFLMHSAGLSNALICNVQNSAGHIASHPANRGEPQFLIPGDGCGVGYLTDSVESPILMTVIRCYGAYASDMNVVTDGERSWWEPHTKPFKVAFDEHKIAKIISRGNRIVPEVCWEALCKCRLDENGIDVFISNQPNLTFLRNWREALFLPEEKHVSSFREHGNLFGAAMPILFEKAQQEGRIKRGAKVLFGGFSHAGDYAAAAVVKV